MLFTTATLIAVTIDVLAFAMGFLVMVWLIRNNEKDLDGYEYDGEDETPPYRY